MKAEFVKKEVAKETPYIDIVPLRWPHRSYCATQDRVRQLESTVEMLLTSIAEQKTEIIILKSAISLAQKSGTETINGNVNGSNQYIAKS